MVNQRLYVENKLTKPKYTVTFSVTEILYVIVVALFITPGYLQTIALVHRGSQLVCAGMSLYYVIKYLRKPSYVMGFALVSLFYTSVLYSTIRNDGEVLRFLVLAIMGIGFFAFILTSSNSSHKFEMMLRAFIVVLEVYVILNLITVFVFPDGLYRIYGYNLNSGSNPAYLLGHRNNAIEYFLPLIGLVCINNKSQGRLISVNLIVVLVVSTITAVLTWSVNEILCIAFLVGSLLIYNKRGIPGYSIKLFLIVSAVASFALINLEVNPVFQNIITNVFHKSTTLSGRTRIWGMALVSISQSFIIGHGIQDNYYNYTRLSTVGSCHNYFLDFLYMGGIVCLVIVIAYVLYISHCFKDVGKDIKSLIAIFFGTYFVLWIATPVHKETVFIMLTFFMVSAIAAKRYISS